MKHLNDIIEELALQQKNLIKTFNSKFSADSNDNLELFEIQRDLAVEESKLLSCNKVFVESTKSIKSYLIEAMSERL